MKKTTNRLDIPLRFGVHIALCGVLAWLYPLASGLLFPRQGWAQLAHANWMSLLIHLAVYVGLFVNTLQLAQSHHGLKTRHVVLLWVACCAALLFSFPGESADIFDYLFRGRMLMEYGQSPLTTTPYQLHDYPFHRYVSWSEWVDAYGPIWEYASAGIAAIVRFIASPDEQMVVINHNCETQAALCSYLIKYIILYRGFSVAMMGTCALLIYHSIPRGQGSSRIALLLLNPMTLVGTAVGAHNEPLLIAFVLLALHFFQKAAQKSIDAKHYAFSLIMILAAAHVKLTALLVLPVFALWVIQRQGWRYAVTLFISTGLIGAGVSWLLYAPLGGWASLPRNLYERSLISTNSWAELLYLTFRQLAGWARFQSQQAATRIVGILFVLCYLTILWRWLRIALHNKFDEISWPPRVGVIVLLYLLIGSYWFQPWYLLWPLAIFCFSPHDARMAKWVMALGLSAINATLLSDYLRNMPAPPINNWQISLFVYIIFIGPIILTMIRLKQIPNLKSLTANL